MDERPDWLHVSGGSPWSQEPSGRENSIAPVVCAVRVPMSREIVQAAVLFCLNRGADQSEPLLLVRRVRLRFGRPGRVDPQGDGACRRVSLRGAPWRRRAGVVRSLFANAVPISGAGASLFATTAFLTHAPTGAQRTVQRAKVLATRPRKAEIIFPWARLGIFEDLSFESTPGPGYSEGGDVFSPARDPLRPASEQSRSHVRGSDT
jgi:hypothetical protein